MTHPSTWTSPACPQCRPRPGSPAGASCGTREPCPPWGRCQTGLGDPDSGGGLVTWRAGCPPWGWGWGFPQSRDSRGWGGGAPRAAPPRALARRTAPEAPRLPRGPRASAAPCGTRSRLETRLLAPLVRPRVDENTRVTIPHHALYLPARVALASAAGGSSGWSPRPFHSPPSLRRLSLFFLI